MSQTVSLYMARVIYPPSPHIVQNSRKLSVKGAVRFPMKRNEKDTINRRTENRYLLHCMKRGLEAVRDTPYKRALLVAYLVGAVLVWPFRAYLFGLDIYGMFSPVLEAVINLFLPLYAVGGLLAVLILLGTPWDGKAAKEGLQKVGLVPCQSCGGGSCPHSQAAGHGQPPVDGLGVRPLRHTPGGVGGQAGQD